MKKIDNFDSLTHLNFPNSTKKEKREKFGSLMLALFGILGLLAINSIGFQQTEINTVNKASDTKFWLTPSSLNAEKTALNSTLIQSDKANQQIIVSANAAVRKTFN